MTARPPLRINQLYAAVAIDDDGDEGVCAFFNEELRSWMPLVAADERRLADIRRISADIARESQKRVRIIKMTTREELEVFDGRQ